MSNFLNNLHHLACVEKNDGKFSNKFKNYIKFFDQNIKNEFLTKRCINFLYEVGIVSYRMAKVLCCLLPDQIKQIWGYYDFKSLKLLVSKGLHYKIDCISVFKHYVEYSFSGRKKILIDFVELFYPYNKKILINVLIRLMLQRWYNLFKKLKKYVKICNFDEIGYTCDDEEEEFYKIIGKKGNCTILINIPVDEHLLLVVKNLCIRKFGRGFITFVAKYKKNEYFIKKVLKLEELKYFAGNIKVFKFLKHLGFDFSKGTELLCENEEFVNFILDSGYTPNEKDILELCFKGHKNVVDILVKKIPFDFNKYAGKLKARNRYEFL